MVESINFSIGADRESIYSEIGPQIAALIAGETDLTANLANIAAALKEAFGFLWVGFYLVREGQLVLGPFQGPVACTRIEFGQGVCGNAYSSRKTLIVPNVNEFPGHIACITRSLSEIVVPMFNDDGSVFGVLDVDSERIDDFTDVDSRALEAIVRLIEKLPR